MSGQKIIEALNDVLNGNIGRITYFGLDMGEPEGDFTVIQCLNCSARHRFRGPMQKRCNRCGRRLHTLRVIK